MATYARSLGHITCDRIYMMYRSVTEIIPIKAYREASKEPFSYIASKGPGGKWIRRASRREESALRNRLYLQALATNRSMPRQLFSILTGFTTNDMQSLNSPIPHVISILR
jgi:hypothetical protein